MGGAVCPGLQPARGCSHRPGHPQPPGAEGTCSSAGTETAPSHPSKTLRILTVGVTRPHPPAGSQHGCHPDHGEPTGPQNHATSLQPSPNLTPDTRFSRDTAPCRLSHGHYGPRQLKLMILSVRSQGTFGVGGLLWEQTVGSREVARPPPHSCPQPKLPKATDSLEVPQGQWGAQTVPTHTWLGPGGGRSHPAEPLPAGNGW